jgi:hypothetical protein
MGCTKLTHEILFKKSRHVIEMKVETLISFMGKQMSKYRVRFFVDHDASCILWGGNDETVEKYDWSPSPEAFPISPELLKDIYAFGREITNRFGYIKSLEDHPQLKAIKDDLIDRLKKELGTDYEIVDEMV